MKIDTKKYKCGDYTKDVRCPKCKSKEPMFILGSRLDKVGKNDWKLKYELECKNGCLFSEWVTPDEFEFSYIAPKKRKDEDEDGNYKLPAIPKKKEKKSNLKKR